MKKNLLLLPILCLLVGMMGSCAKSSLAVAVDEMNKSLPESCGNGVDFTKVTYENDVVTCHFTTSEDDAITVLQGMEKLSLKWYLASSMIEENDADFMELLDALIAANAGFNFVYRGIQSGSSVTISFSPLDVQSLRNGTLKMTPMESLNVVLDVTRAELPIQLDEITTCVDIQIEDGYVVYYYIVEEDYDFLICEIDNYAKNEIRASLRDNLKLNCRDVMESCVAANCGIVYYYIGSLTSQLTDQDEFGITFTVSDLKRLLKE
ncbi:MAG: hypothetical protein Q4D14_06445 [Bacteroidales bacterium]|nr:hypothetical protein [Bacteroidales bacterium]